MFRCGIAYPRCRWIVPLLLLFAVIFDLIAVAAQSGWVEDENAKSHYASMWTEYRGRNNNWDARTLMGNLYHRCRWIMLLLMLFAVILDLTAIAAQSGWVEDKDAKSHYTSMWQECRDRGNKWKCVSLMELPWAQAVAALMVIGLIILILAFIVSIISMCSVNTSLFRGVAGMLIIVVIIQIIALIIYPIKFNERIFEGQYYYTWAYGFGWGATILSLGCAILFCCLPKYEDEISGIGKTKYFYTSP